jgi:hypothetical protein
MAISNPDGDRRAGSSVLVITRGSIPGCARTNPGKCGISQRSAKLGRVLIRTSPVSANGPWRSVAAIAPMRSSAGAISAINSRPAAVSLTFRTLRLNSGCPRSSSSTRTCLLTAPCVTPSSSAACVKLA